MTQRDDHLQNTEAFIAGKQDTLHMYSGLRDGHMEVTGYYILPGIYLVYNDIHTQIVANDNQGLTKNILLINYCEKGRCEFKTFDDRCHYIEGGMINASAQMVQDSFYYPSSFYQGYEIYILCAAFTEQTYTILDNFEISPDVLLERYDKGAAGFVSEKLLKVWKQLSEYFRRKDIGQIRLEVLRILKMLQDQPMSMAAANCYLSKGQAVLVKKAHEILTEDLSRHISVKTIAAGLGVSETSLKRYFRMVYGAGVAAYMNTRRMQYATELLAEGKMSISDIAKACGYVNQGRFAKVFREYYGMKPLDYRRVKREERIEKISGPGDEH